MNRREFVAAGGVLAGGLLVPTLAETLEISTRKLTDPTTPVNPLAVGVVVEDTGSISTPVTTAPAAPESDLSWY